MAAVSAAAAAAVGLRRVGGHLALIASSPWGMSLWWGAWRLEMTARSPGTRLRVKIGCSSRNRARPLCRRCVDAWSALVVGGTGFGLGQFSSGWTFCSG